MADERDPVDELLDAALFAPLGLFLEARDRRPELAERGRQHFEAQVGVARMIGKFAVQIASKKVAEFVQRERPASPAPAAPPADGPPVTAEHADGDGDWVSEDLVPTDAADLPIPGYDTLAASQVVARLAGLDAAGLEAVRAYEATHRNRKTVLGRIAQLQRAA